VVVLIFIVNAETYHDPVEEPLFTIFLTPGIEILTGVENQLVLTCYKTSALKQGLLTTAIIICDGVGYGILLTVAKKIDTDRGSGAAIGDIQYMCR